MSTPLQAGMTRELVIQSKPEHSARHFYPNLPDVFATPYLGGLMEQVCAELIDEHLEPGQQSVGISMNLKHLAATPLGMKIKVTTEISAVEGNKITFQLEAFDAEEKIGKAVHERFIINAEKFNMRVAKKAKKISA